MTSYRDLWQELCSYENLELAFKKARKHKTLKLYVIEFEENLKANLLQLRAELLMLVYKPKPLETFILRDPKTRKISKSHFRDRVVHHALCNIIEPILEKRFIFDSYANRKGKGTLKALQRFDYFKRKVSKNNKKHCFILKADIKHYFDTVDHNILLNIIKRKIKDKNIVWLVKTILQNHKTKEENRGMPLGNLTSQFFANVYLNELDYFVKHKLNVKFYIRYVDDFVIFDISKKRLLEYKNKINIFLETIKLELHPDKSKIRELKRGIGFLGFRIFEYHKLLKKNNILQMKKRLETFKKGFEKSKIDYNKVYLSIEGWFSYANTANTYSLKKRFIERFDNDFSGNIADVEISRWTK